MVSVNLMQLRRRVRSRLGVPVSDQFFTDDVLDDHINLAADVLDSEQWWPWHEVLTTQLVMAGTGGFTVPDDWRATRSLFVGDDEIINISPADLMLRPANYSGRPEVWAVLGPARIEIRPFPDTDYTLTHLYYRLRTQLVEDDDTLDVPDQYAGAVIAKAAELLSTREDNRTAAAAHMAEYATWLARMRRDLRRSTGPIRIRVREGSWI